MSDTPDLGFAKFVPGFDFLQNLAKGAGAGMPQMPSLSNWVAPTLSVEELDKRITELKAVQFWLDQNAKALAATVQALEVQKMTLATLRGMNVSMAEVAGALKARGEAFAASFAPGGTAAAAPAAAPQQPAPDGEAKEPPAAAVDPLQWWGALTRQFQQIAADALQDATRHTAADTARHMAEGMAKDAAKDAAKAGAAKTAARKPAAKTAGKATAPAGRKTAARKGTARNGSRG